MKPLIVTLILIIASIPIYGQAPGGTYGEYEYAYSIGNDGDSFERSTFPRISAMVFSTSFMRQAMYRYMGIGGQWFDSAMFDWAGFNNGWYVYAYRLGINYNYFLISKNLKIIRIQESSNKGIVDVYLKCDPNEKMNKAPTF